MSAVFDLIVVGAGPAGSATAITAARKGARALLLEKDELPRHKVCGEFISFESLDLLERLLEQRLAGHLMTHVRLFRGREVRTSRLPRPALSISRYELDHCLARSAHAAGVQVVTGSRVKGVVTRNDEKVVVTEDGESCGKSVVNAAGRWSELQPRTELPAKRLVGLKQHFFEENSPNSTDLYFFPGGYCGVQPIGDKKVNVCALVDASAASTLNTVFTRSKLLFERAIKWQPASELFATAPIFFAPPQPVAGGVINVGDAAAFIDPFLGDGISIALQTGVLAGECAFQQDGQNTYRREYLRRVAPAFRRAARLRQWLASPWAWRAMRIPGVIALAARSTRVAII